MQVLAVAEGQNPVDGSALIFFQITGPLQDGGLAEGMSGSPLSRDRSGPTPTTTP